jgi:peptidyl-prolyl cis-trans isomerase A (cyclophilin A)
MLRHSVLIATCFLALPAAIQAQTIVPATAPTVRVSLHTSAGDIVIELERAKAPITAGNFLRYVDQKRFDGTIFYRALKVAPGYGLIQGGTRNDPKKVLPPIKLEPTSTTGLAHDDGTISMARGAPNSANGDFFITVGKMSSMDADPTKPGDDALGFAVFGRVVEGMEVVKTILESPTSPTEGEGVMKGQMLDPKIKIVTARRVPSPPPAPVPPAAPVPTP